MSSYQKLRADSDVLDEMGYSPVGEQIYTKESDEIVEWTRFFEQRAGQTLDFAGFHAATPASFEKAVAVGTQWYRFSSFMPYFLCQAAAYMTTNEKRHYVIQTAFEELGMREVGEIHPEMFKQSCEEVGVTSELFERFSTYDPIAKQLSFLKEHLLAAKDDSYVLGMLLGLELPAEDNISSVYWSVAYDSRVAETLMKNKFFRLHMALECEHVRLTVSNFIRFCSSNEQKEHFIEGFDAGITFWRAFWDELATLTAGCSVVRNLA